jgi:hypothetical protein
LRRKRRPPKTLLAHDGKSILCPVASQSVDFPIPCFAFEHQCRRPVEGLVEEGMNGVELLVSTDDGA